MEVRSRSNGDEDCRRAGIRESVTQPKGAEKSQPAIAESEPVIALHSPYALLETGLQGRRAEKS